MKLRALALIFAAAATLAAGSAAAQPQRGGERGGRGAGQGAFRGPQKMQPAPGRRVLQPQGPDQRRPERMTPEDREKLRRDIEDANRGMERRR